MQVTEDTEEMRFNTAIAGMMEFINGAQKWEGLPPKAAVEPFVLLLSPYAPHLAEELWQVSSILHRLPGSVHGHTARWTCAGADLALILMHKAFCAAATPFGDAFGRKSGLIMP